jgi:hypothetical protein
MFYWYRGGAGEPVEQAGGGQGRGARLPGLQEDYEEGQGIISQLKKNQEESTCQTMPWQAKHCQCHS